MPSACPEHPFGVLLLDLFGLDAVELDPRLVGDTAMDERFQQTFVGLLETHVLADHGDAHVVFGILQNVNDSLPIVQMRRAGPDIELFDDPLVESFFVKAQRHFVNPFDVLVAVMTAFSVDVAEMRDLVLDFLVEVAIGAAEQDIGLNTDAASAL